MGEAPIFPSTTLLPLSEHNTVWELAAPYASASQTERVVITVAIHGNEPCGVLATNELLKEGFFAFAAGGPDSPPWPAHLKSLTILLGNPQAFQTNVRFIDSNLNRDLTAPIVAASQAAAKVAASNPFGSICHHCLAAVPLEPRTGPCRKLSANGIPDGNVRQLDGSRSVHNPGNNAGACTKLGVEKSRAALVAAAIGGATLYVDIHSSSAAAPAFVFHTPGAVTEAHAATFPAPYLIEDTTLVGTTFSWAVERGVARAALVECGQHSSRAAIDIAKRTIVRMVTGEVEALDRVHLVNAGSVPVRRGFRYAQDVQAFQRVAHGELIGYDDVDGEIRCPQPSGACIVM